VSEDLDRVFDSILAGRDNLLDGFGLVRTATRGPRTPSGFFKWEDRMEVAGDGRIRMTVVRSLGDMPGSEPGVYEMQKDKDFVLNLVRLVKQSKLDALPPSRVEPADVMIRVEVVGGGLKMERAIAASDRRAAALLNPLLNAFIPISEELQHNPVMSLSLGLAAPPRAPTGTVRVTVGLTFRNFGKQGYWLMHPMGLSGEDDGCELLYGKRVEVRDDIMPEPVVVLQAPLTTRGKSMDAIWMAPAAETTVDMIATLQCGSPGRYFMRARYSSYMQGPALGGRPCLVGTAFSPDIDMDMT
jgi:hypothetical protein